MRNQSEPLSLAAIKTPISQEALDQLFREARSHSTWLPEPVPVELLREAYELARLGPTSANGSPASLQAAYFILAARALGLDCGPMSGFDADKLNAEFFPDGKWKVNLLCNLGYGDPSKLHPCNPRLNFEEASLIL